MKAKSEDDQPVEDRRNANDYLPISTGSSSMKNEITEVLTLLIYIESIMSKMRERLIAGRGSGPEQ